MVRVQSGSVLKAKCNVTPCVLLSFPLSLLCFPLVSLQHPCSLLASATFAAHLCWLISIPDLSSLRLCEPRPAFFSDQDCTLPEHSPHGADKFLLEDKNTGHMPGTRHSTSGVLLTSGHLLGPPFMKPQVFSKCVSMTVAGYLKALSATGGQAGT